MKLPYVSLVEIWQAWIFWFNSTEKNWINCKKKPHPKMSEENCYEKDW